MESYAISDDITVSVVKYIETGEKTVLVKENGSFEKSVELTPSRWAELRTTMNEINQKLKEMLEGGDVKYRHHIGGAFYVSVTSGYRCVDLSKFFVPDGDIEPKPTRRGIGLRLREWEQMPEIIEKIDDKNPDLATAMQCYVQDDHNNQMGALECRECHPFGLL